MHGQFKDELAFHGRVGHAVSQHFRGEKHLAISLGRRVAKIYLFAHFFMVVTTVCAGVDVGQFLGVGTVGMELGGQNAPVRLVGGLENDRSGPVAKNDGHVSAPGTEVETHGVHFGADHQHVFVHPGLHKLVADRKGIDKPAALVAHIEGAHFALRDAQLALHQHAAAGEVVVRAKRGKNDEIHLVGRDASPFAGDTGGGGAHGRSGLLMFHAVPPLPDAGALLDPGVIGVHDFGEFVIGDDAFREVVADAGYFAAHHVVVDF